MDTKPGDIITIETEEGILHEMTVESVNQDNRTVTGLVAWWKTDKLHMQNDRKIVRSVTVPDHWIRDER